VWQKESVSRATVTRPLTTELIRQRLGQSFDAA